LRLQPLQALSQKTNTILDSGQFLQIQFLVLFSALDVGVVVVLSTFEIQVSEEVRDRPCLLSGRRGVANSKVHKVREINEIGSMMNVSEEAF
jgi:ABC-type uncharacterized transport system ATPase subunit